MTLPDSRLFPKSPRDISVFTATAKYRLLVYTCMFVLEVASHSDENVGSGDEKIGYRLPGR